MYAVEKHGDQKRKSGEPYIIHPTNVAYTIAELGLDEHTICAALLHDVDDHKLSPQTCKNKDHAREILKTIDCDDTTIERVCEIIDGISWSKNKDKKPKDLTVACVQDADWMSAIGSMGIVRACRYGGAVGMPMQESIDHFYEKLLDVRDKLNTNTAKQISLQIQVRSFNTSPK